MRYRSAEGLYTVAQCLALVTKAWYIVITGYVLYMPTDRSTMLIHGQGTEVLYLRQSEIASPVIQQKMESHRQLFCLMEACQHDTLKLLVWVPARPSLFQMHSWGDFSYTMQTTPETLPTHKVHSEEQRLGSGTPISLLKINDVTHKTESYKEQKFLSCNCVSC